MKWWLRPAAAPAKERQKRGIFTQKRVPQNERNPIKAKRPNEQPVRPSVPAACFPTLA
ncbi:hypothetical protein B4109_0356 [Geobacillus stearothermophilus]|uniref:Uncharacterized protein n=1 Tax=Geobacillus stearothermophilus TaxID=1422 RepID=A0A150MYC6_GEOSE|nr:hypothetical protein B4109_0356 [Geobacillus stearothermophilus]